MPKRVENEHKRLLSRPFQTSLSVLSAYIGGLSGVKDRSSQTLRIHQEIYDRRSSEEARKRLSREGANS